MEVVIMYDQEKKKSRGFGFLSFEDDASVERVTREHYINLNGKQVEIKKAEPRDGSGGSKGQNDNGQWGQPQGAPMGMMQGPNGQIGGPPMNMPMGAPNMMPGYQAWGTSQQQGYGYGANAPASYPNWGAPPGPQQWNNYPAAQQQPNYSNYGKENLLATMSVIVLKRFLCPVYRNVQLDQRPRWSVERSHLEFVDGAAEFVGNSRNW